MAPFLELCPEIIEVVVVFMELRDICSLRLTSQTMASLATQDRFKTYFRKKQVDLTRISLQNFVHATKPGSLGCIVRELTLTGIVNNTNLLAATTRNSARYGEDACIEAQRHIDVLTQRQNDYNDLHQSGMDVTLLSEAFSNLANRSRYKNPVALCLGIVVYRTDSEQRSAPCGLEPEQLTDRRIERFPHLDRCSIACNDLGAASIQGLKLVSLASARSLGLSVSDRIIEESQAEYDRNGDTDDELEWEAAEIERTRPGYEAEATDETNFSGLAKLVHKYGALETLDLHQYSLKAPNVRLHREKLLPRIIEMDPLPHLRNLTLRGVAARGQDLLALVQNRPLRSINLQDIGFAAGSFRSIPNHCSGENTAIERVYFEDLKKKGMIQFDGPRKLKYEISSLGIPRSSTLDRSGAEVREPITYHVPNGLILGSPSFAEWRANRRIAYGPP